MTSARGFAASASHPGQREALIRDLAKPFEFRAGRAGSSRRVTGTYRGDDPLNYAEKFRVPNQARRLLAQNARRLFDAYRELNFISKPEYESRI